jgi:hypothetical protein
MANKYTANRKPTFDIWGEFWIDPTDGQIHIGGWDARRELFQMLKFDGPHYERITFRRWSPEEKRELRKLASEPDPKSNTWIPNNDNLLYHSPRVLITDWSLVDEQDKPIPVTTVVNELAFTPGRGILTSMLSEETFVEWKDLPSIMQDYFARRGLSSLEFDGRGDEDPRVKPEVLEQNLEADGTKERVEKREQKGEEVPSPNPFSAADQANDSV